MNLQILEHQAQILGTCHHPESRFFPDHPHKVWDPGRLRPEDTHVSELPEFLDNEHHHGVESLPLINTDPPTCATPLGLE